MAEMGSVAFNFERKGVLRVEKSGIGGKEEDVMMAAVDAGAEDVLNLEAGDDSDEEVSQGSKISTLNRNRCLSYRLSKSQVCVWEKKMQDTVVILTAPEDWNAVKESMQEQGVEIIIESSGQEMIPVAYAEGQPDAEEELQNLIDKLLELDDVDAVYHNFQCA